MLCITGTVVQEENMVTRNKSDLSIFSSIQSQGITTFESAIPLVRIFAVPDYKKPFGTFAKALS